MLSSQAMQRSGLATPIFQHSMQTRDQPMFLVKCCGSAFTVEIDEPECSGRSMVANSGLMPVLMLLAGPH